MTTTFLKRQKEMKRMEKQREKAERRAQKKLANQSKPEDADELKVLDAMPEAEIIDQTELR
jgi:hypothetical protein